MHEVLEVRVFNGQGTSTLKKNGKTFFKLYVYKPQCIRVLAGAAAVLVKQVFKNMNTWFYLFLLYI